MKCSIEKITKQFKLYKDRQLVFNGKEQTTGTVLYNLNPSKDSLFSLYKSNTFFTRYFRSYYIPRYIFSKNLKNKKFTNTQLDRYKEVKEKCQYIKITKPKLNMYPDLNIIFDTYFYTEKFNLVYAKYPYKKKITLFQNFLKEIIDTFSNKNKIFYLNPTSVVTPNSDNIESILYALSYYGLVDESLLGNCTFIIYSKTKNIFFKVDGIFNKGKNFNILKFKRFVNIIAKLDTNVELDNEEKQTYVSEIKQADEDNLDTASSAETKYDYIKSSCSDTIKEKLNLTNKTLSDKQLAIMDSMEKKISNAVDKRAKNTPTKVHPGQAYYIDHFSSTDILDELNKDKEFIKDLSNLKASITEYSNGKKNISVNNDKAVSGNDYHLKDVTEEEEKEEEELKKSEREAESDETETKNSSEIEFSNDTSEEPPQEEIDYSAIDDFLDQEKASAKDIEKLEKNKARLQSKQDEVKFTNDKTIKSILDEFEVTKIEEKEIPIDVINKEVKHSKLKDLDTSYNKYQKDHDTALIISSFNNDPDIPLYVTNVKVTDKSDSFNKVDDMEITFEGADGSKHTVHIDMPKVVDGGFLYLNGGKKAISKQFTLLPVLKSKSDTVQITTNYSKIFLIRFGQKLDPNVERLKKFFNKEISDYPSIKFKLGNNIGTNSQYVNSLEYNELSNYMIELKFKSYYFNFNREMITYELEDQLEISYDVKDDEILFGFDKENKYLFVSNVKTNEVTVKTVLGKVIATYSSIYQTLVTLLQEVNEDIPKKINAHIVPKKMMYTRASIIGEKVPLIILLAFYFGFTNVLKAANINYRFSATKLSLTEEEKEKYGNFKFKDGYLYFDLYPLRNSLLLNGLSEVPTSEISLTDLDNKDYYLELFNTMYNSANKAKGLNNFLCFFLDPITIDVCKMCNLPTDLLGLILYANTLLEDESVQKQNDLSNYRIRSTELINAHLYRILADGFKAYKDKAKNTRSRSRIMIKPDQLTKDLLESPLVDDYSILSPISEAEKMGLANYKGLSGINSDDAFTIDVRAYDKSMLGAVGLNTPDSGKAGSVRQLSLDPRIINNRGMLDQNMSIDDMSAINLFTPTENLACFTSLHADPPRIAMQAAQSKHLIPTARQNKPLFGSGVDKSIAYVIGDDFAFKAKQPGKVLKIDEEKQLMLIQYKDGTSDVVDLSPVQAKNGNGGFYITNKKEAIIKEGQTFKEGEILAKNSDYFLGNKAEDVIFASGYIAKIAMHSGDYTLEDSSMISDDLSKALASKVTMVKHLNLGVNSNILSMVKIGDSVKTGEPLCVFEQSFDDSDANKLLDSLGDEFNDVIEEMGKNEFKSKYTGEIVDIKIYYNRDIEDFQPSVQKIIKAYNKRIEDRKSLLKGQKIDTTNIVFPPTGKQNITKMRNDTIDGIYIEFYIRYTDIASIGDKITFSVALKTTISKVVPDKEAPYSDYHKDERIDAIISPLSVISRMTTDVFNIMYLNKVLIELKNKALETYFD